MTSRFATAFSLWTRDDLWEVWEVLSMYARAHATRLYAPGNTPRTSQTSHGCSRSPASPVPHRARSAAARPHFDRKPLGLNTENENYE